MCHKVSTTRGQGTCGFIQKRVIAHIKRDRKASWPIVKRQKLSVAHVKTSWLFFSELVVFSYLDVPFCKYVSIMSLQLLPYIPLHTISTSSP